MTNLKMTVPNFIRTPAQSTSSFLEYAELLREKQSLTFGCVMDNHVIPPHPGDVISIVARPGHGKTAFMSYMARRAAQIILDEGKYSLNENDTSEVVLYVSWEQSTEEIEANMQAGQDYSVSDIAWGRADMDIVRKKAFGRPQTPIWLVGKSIQDANKRMPPMTFDIIYDNIQGLKEKFNVVPRLICMDYLQIIPVPEKSTRLDEVSEAAYKTKQLALDTGCPIFIGVQAKEAVDKSASKIPGLGDCYYGASISHVVDKNFGLFKPDKVYDKGKDIGLNGTPYSVDDYLLLIEMSKQRMDQGSRKWAINFDMSKMEVWDFDKWAGQGIAESDKC
jgi:replicative DNA helicase